MTAKVSVLPVKCTPPSSGLLKTQFPNTGPLQGRKFTIPSGSPASFRIFKMIQHPRMLLSEGFQRLTLPMTAGAEWRLAAIAMKLKGVIAATKPSKGRYSCRFHTPKEFSDGCCAYSCCANLPRNRQKSIVSTAASISACHTFLPCPSMTAAQSSARYFVLSKSAALRKIAMRCSDGYRSHSFFASRATAMADWMTSGVALWYVHSTCWWFVGIVCLPMSPVRISLPPTTHGMSGHSAFSRFMASRRAARSEDPGG
mmetsp:Transcript_35646/g.63698  ORF Transcript_35646/g.63698 Transcript_35646/m.63698 type:complete len:256 (-) Transcript_35646:206-973(-)